MSIFSRLLGRKNNLSVSSDIKKKDARSRNVRNKKKIRENPCKSMRKIINEKNLCKSVKSVGLKQSMRKRVEEQKRFISEFPAKYKVSFIEGDYDTKEFYDIAKGYEQCREGGERCFRCYELRLKKTCETAKAGGFDYFTTTLTISPLKNSVRLNEIGLKLSEEYDMPYLLSDFKKKEGYKRSIELSHEYNLYRQNYCGCVYSR